MAGTETGSVYQELYGTTSPVTGSAPTLATDGQQMDGLFGISVVASAASGITLSGAGTLLCYVYDQFLARWVRFPSLDLSITIGAATARDQGYQGYQTVTPRKARIKWVPSGVTFSSGSGAEVHGAVAGRPYVSGLQRGTGYCWFQNAIGVHPPLPRPVVAKVNVPGRTRVDDGAASRVRENAEVGVAGAALRQPERRFGRRVATEFDERISEDERIRDARNE